MYTWIWHRLPGRPAARTAWLLLLVLAVAVLLWLVVFPWASVRLPIDPA
ncbi:MAG TPA: hypothetical protein VGG35_01355 [Streptosporangiaceae bacterium]|jgi:uncharacterized membrane-anchored protein